MKLDELVEQAAFDLVGLHKHDQGAAITAACETLAKLLHAQRPCLTDAQVRLACVGLVNRVRARLREIDSQSARQQVHWPWLECGDGRRSRGSWRTPSSSTS